MNSKPTFSHLDTYIRTRFLYLLLFIFCCTMFLTHYHVAGQAVYGDGIGYYAHLRSWVIDRDWDYTAEYKHNYSAENNNAIQPTVAESVQIVAVTPDGKAENHYSPGVAVLLLPFYLIAHLVSLLLAASGVSVSLSGYGDIYQIVTGMGAICYVVLGLWLLQKIIQKVSGDIVISRIVVISIFISTPLLYYGSYDVINSHFASFFLMCSLYYVYLFQRDTLTKIFLLGLVGGMLTINRLQDGVVSLLWILLETKKYFFIRPAVLLQRVTIYTIGFVLALWPLLYHWQNTFNGVFQHTYFRNLVRDTSGGSIDIFGSLFHFNNGLFINSPILFLALMYFIFRIVRKGMPDYQIVFWFFILQVIIITVQGGWFATAFGGRMYISTLPFFALVLADMYAYLRMRSKHLFYIMPAIFGVWNIITAMHFVLWH